MLYKILFLQLLNYIGDYPLQTDFLGILKSKYHYMLFVHCFIWAGVICCGLYYLEIFSMWKMLFLFFGHYVIDYWKCRMSNENKRLTTNLWIDQFLHFIQIIVVAF